MADLWIKAAVIQVTDEDDVDLVRRKVGVACLLRKNETDDTLTKYAKHLSELTIEEAECLAVGAGLILCQKLGVKTVTVHTSCNAVYQRLTDTGYPAPTPKFDREIHQIKHQLDTELKGVTIKRLSPKQQNSEEWRLVVELADKWAEKDGG